MKGFLGLKYSLTTQSNPRRAQTINVFITYYKDFHTKLENIQSNAITKRKIVQKVTYLSLKIQIEMEFRYF